MTKPTTKRKRSVKRSATFTLRSDNKSLLTTPFEHLARTIAETHFANVKSVSLFDNEKRKTVARWNYGHRQPLRNRK